MRLPASFAATLARVLVLLVGIRPMHVARAAAADSDGDGVSDAIEDLDGNGDPSNDDTDGDDVPNGLDDDDDDDGIPTRDEDTDGNGDPTDDFTDLFGPDEGPDYLNPNVPRDRDHDTYVAVAFGGDDCADDRGSIHPGVDHDPLYDGEDWDCDGGEFEFDGDRDGYDSRAELLSGDDCNDYDPTVHPGVEEDFGGDFDAGLGEGGDVDRDCDGWLDPVGTLVPDGGCDCGSTGASGGGGLVLLAVCAAVRRRR